MKSGKLAVNVLIHLNNLKINPSASFDFINKMIEPQEANTKESNRLLNDYLNWLPIHFKNHNCDISKLEKLIITISTDFENVITPSGMNKCQQIHIKTTANWKSANRDEEIIELISDEVIDKYYLKVGIPGL
jgi:hypothetical protein